VVRELCDYCVVELREEDGTTRRLMANSADPAKAHLCEMLLARGESIGAALPRLDGAGDAAAGAVREVKEDMLRELAQSPHHLRLLRRDRAGAR